MKVSSPTGRPAHWRPYYPKIVVPGETATLMGAADLVVAVRVALALLWWKLCHYVHHFLYVKSVAPRSQYFHKIAVIGDDFAAGVGDYVTITSSAGIAHYLPGILQRSDKVRHRWEIVNAGVPGSFSGDWTMNAPKQYFNKVFNARSTRDADIVIVILGSVELRSSSAMDIHAVKRNLMAICDALRKKGKKVCLATAVSPAPLANDSEKIPLNLALEEFCASTTTEDIPVVLGPRLDSYAFRRETALSYDGYRFNSSSYKLLARNTADFLIPMVTAVEWATWKNQLDQVKYDKTLYD